MGEATLMQDTNTTPEIAQAMQPVLAGIKGITSTTVMSNRGVTTKTDLKTPATSSAQAKQYLDQVKGATAASSAELPEEAVGVGAKWESKQQTKVQAAAVEQTASYELTALDGDKLTTKFTATEAGAKSASGINANVTGTATVDLSKVLTPSAQINSHMEVPVGRDKNTVVKMDVSISVDAQ